MYEEKEKTDVDPSNDTKDKYSEVKNLAFFMVNFGISKKEYNELTEPEKVYLMRAWEDKVKFTTTLMRDATLNAIANGFRKENSRFIELFTFKKKRKKPTKKQITELKAMVESQDKSWLDVIFQNVGYDPRKRKVGD